MTAQLAMDANAYGEILAGTAAGARLRALASAERTRLVVLLPVISELLQRVAPARVHDRVLAVFYDPVPAERRVAPSPADWIKVGRTVSALAAAGHDREELKRRNFYLDLHVAVLCRARGITLVTADQDHDRIRPYVGHATAPFPA